MVVRKMKEKCKDAARMRREKERAEFVELSKLLPLPSSTTSQLDKASIIRLTSSYLRMRAAFPQGLGENWGHKNLHKILNQPTTFVPNNAGDEVDGLQQYSKALGQVDLKQRQQQMNQVRELGSLLLQTLDGFVFALHRDGKIMYISETASVHLGLPQIDLTGSSVFEYVHPSDHNDIYAILGLSEMDRAQLELSGASSTTGHHELGRSFCMRMKCILPKRNAGLVSSGYKAIHCNGYLKVKSKLITENTSQVQPQPNCDLEWESYALVAVGHSLLPTASTEVKLTGNSFMFRANLDLKIYYIEAPVVKFLGFDQIELIGQSLYQFVHVNDTSALESSHRSLLEKGQVVTKYYRLMKRDGGFVWVQSYATIVNNLRNMPKPHHIVSICFVLAENPFDLSAIVPQNQQHLEQTLPPPRSTDACLTSTTNSSDGVPIKSVSSGYESASSVGGHRDDGNRVQQRSQRKDKYSAQRRLRKLRTSLGSTVANNKGVVLSSNHPSPGGINKPDSTSNNHQPALKTASHKQATCDRCQQQDHHQCSCTHMVNQYYPMTVPTIIGSLRRPSDDTCSIVSSVASTSLSSNASSHRASDFMGYTSVDTLSYQASSCLDPNIIPVTHSYRFDRSTNKGLQQDIAEPSAYNGFVTNQLLIADRHPHLMQCEDPAEFRDQQIWLTTPTNGHFDVDEMRTVIREPQVDDTQMISFNQESCNIAPQPIYLQSSPDWSFAHDNHCINQIQTFGQQTQQASGFVCQCTDERVINYSDTSTSSQYHESPPYSNNAVVSTIHYNHSANNNRYTMSSSSN